MCDVTTFKKITAYVQVPPKFVNKVYPTYENSSIVLHLDVPIVQLHPDLSFHKIPSNKKQSSSPKVAL